MAEGIRAQEVGSSGHKRTTLRINHRPVYYPRGHRAMSQRGADPQEAATLPPEAGPWGGSVMGGRNSAFSLPDRLAISGSWAS